MMRSERGSSALGVAMCAATFAATLTAVPAGAQSGRRPASTRVTADSQRTDSAAMGRASTMDSDLMRLIGELIASRRTEERLAQSLRETGNDDPKVQSIELELHSLARRNAMLASTIRLQCARDDMQPEGFMGVNFVGIELRRDRGGPTMYYFDSTRIVSVDPGSPAQRAGLTANDEVVSIGGLDVNRPIPLGRVLKPGAKVQVKVLRAGETRAVTVVVGKRADDTSAPCATLDDGVFASRAPQLTIVTPDARRSGYGGSGDRGGSASRSWSRSDDNNNGRSRGQAGFNSLPPFASGSFSSFAGAQLMPLDADWRDMTGMDKGLLVIRVAPGSPAESVGLRKTDVITAVDDSIVTTAAGFWRLVGGGGPDGVTLRVMRARQPVTIVFRSRDPR